jgi:hypothetical protein
MIEADIYLNDKLTMQRYYEPSISLEQALKKLELYVINEQFNIDFDCVIKSRYSLIRIPCLKEEND